MRVLSNTAPCKLDWTFVLAFYCCKNVLTVSCRNETGTVVCPLSQIPSVNKSIENWSHIWQLQKEIVDCLVTIEAVGVWNRDRLSPCFFKKTVKLFVAKPVSANVVVCIYLSAQGWGGHAALQPTRQVHRETVRAGQMASGVHFDAMLVAV